jgi:hypothetical protein
MRRAIVPLVLATACGGADFGGPGPLPPSAPIAAPSPVAPGGNGTRGDDAIPVLVTADQGAGTDAVVSLGVPFPPGALRDASLALVDPFGASVPRDARILARWPADGSVRSVLVAFKATLAPGEAKVFRLKRDAQGRAATIAPSPDGPFTASLPASWYAESLVTGASLPVTSDARFAAYESRLERGLAEMNPPYESHGVDCERTTNHRTYYDGPHAFFQRFARNPSPSSYRRARAEAGWYRAHELRFVDGRAMAVEVCERKDWTPARPLAWDVLRRMTGQGMLDDHLLTGDPAAREAVLAMGEALLRDLPALVDGRENTLRVTERNMAWTLMGLAAAYALEPRADLRRAMTQVVDDAIAWQAAGKSGAFEHDIARPDPEECARGPRGASPFMTSLLVDALIDYQSVTHDGRVADVVRRVATWYEKDAVTSDGRAFRYLWGCSGDPMDDSGVADLNLLIVHVFGAAYALTGDKHWLSFGDRIADSGIDAMATTNPKQWNQAARSFGRWLGYRSKALPP